MPSLSPARVLHFDIENRPLSYWCDRPSAEVTAIAWSWADEAKVHCSLLCSNGFMVPTIAKFMGVYAEADIVSGHYIRKHDLPILNGMLIDKGLPILRPKLVSDTRLDLPKLKDLPVSQEALAEYLGCKAPKIGMSQPAWRDANRLTESGLKKTYARCVADVRQHKEMRAKLLERGLLKGPRIWSP